MKSLNAFLNPGKQSNEYFPLSRRFKNSDGSVAEWEVRPITPREAQIIAKKCRSVDKKGIETFDSVRYQNELIVASVVEPDLKNAQLQSSYAVMGEIDLLTEMLNMGEYADLRSKVFSISGIIDDVNDTVEEAKN